MFSSSAMLLPQRTWIGARDLLVNNQGFAWTDGTTAFSYTAWTSGKPSDPAEDCALMAFSAAGAWKWNDVPCGLSYESLCERPQNVNLISSNP